MPRLAALIGATPAVAQTTERIDTAAGTSRGFSGDNGPATLAQLAFPSDVASLGPNSYLIADTSNNRIRQVDENGVITTIAGTGPAGFVNGAATDNALLNGPRGVTPTGSAGSILIAATENNAIRIVSDGSMNTTVNTSGTPRATGVPGTPATARLNKPRDVVALPDGSYLIADTGNNRILRVDAARTEITRVAGTDTAGFNGNGPDATAAQLSGPSAIAPLAGGGFLIADTGNNRIRRVATNTGGAISTVAGSETAGYGGDGGSATSAAARLLGPEGVVARPDGGILIADTGNQRVRDVSAAGIIRTVAGNGLAGLSGDGGPGTLAQLDTPRSVALGLDRAWVADTGNDRVRLLTGTFTPEPTPTPSPTPIPTPTPQPPPTSDPAPPLDVVPPGLTPPEIGRTVVAREIAGRVRVRLRGSGDFVELDTAGPVPLGSEFDTRRGTVELFFQTAEDGTDASSTASGGFFIARQPRKRVEGQRPGELALSEQLSGCPSLRSLRRASSARGTGAIASAARRRRRHVRVRARGKIKTRGRYGSAIVRGTGWTTKDICRGPRSGTLFSTFEGVIAVTDDVQRRTVRVPAGKRYLVRAR